MWHFFWHGTFSKLLLIALTPLYLFVFWTSLWVIGCQMMNKIFPYEMQGWNWNFNFFWSVDGRRCKCCWYIMFNFPHQKRSCWGFGLFSFFFKEVWKNKHIIFLKNLLCWTLSLIFLFNIIIIGCEQKKAIVEEYDKNVFTSHAF